VALGLIYQMFFKLLDWLVLRARSDTSKDIEILRGSRTSHMVPTSGDRRSPVVGHDRRRVAAAAVPDLPPDAEAGLAAGTQHLC
jgi:hypothetical protein